MRCMFYIPYIMILPIPKAGASKGLLFGRSLVGIVIWNPVGGMDAVSCVSVVCCQVEASE